MEMQVAGIKRTTNSKILSQPVLFVRHKKRVNAEHSPFDDKIVTIIRR